ncbi:MAG: hypothetical protein ACI8SI_001266, partial [Congregibacter sp.]
MEPGSSLTVESRFLRSREVNLPIPFGGLARC